MDYQDKALEAHRATVAAFYIPDARLFREHEPSRAQDPVYSFLWPFISAFAATNALLGLPGTGEKYLPLLRDLVAGVEQYWLAPGYESYVVSAGGAQRYYDDNAWLGLELLEAYKVLHEQTLLDRCQEVFDFVLSGWSEHLGGGLYWREGDGQTKNTCSNGPAAVLAARLYTLTGDARYLDWARRIYNWTGEHLRAPDGLYWDSIDQSGEIDRSTYTYNAGIMIQAGLLLYQATGDARYRREAEETGAASFAHFAVSSGQGLRSFPATPWFNSVLFRGYLALETATGESTCVLALLQSLDNGWARARDDRGLVHPDWSGRSGAAMAHAALLDQAPVAEIYALAAHLPGTGSDRPLAPVDSLAWQGELAPAAWQAPPAHALSPLGTVGTSGRFSRRGLYESKIFGAYVLTGELYAYYDNLGGPNGPLGFPVAKAEPAGTSPWGTRGMRQLFEGSLDYSPAVLARLGDVRCGAVVYWNAATGVHATSYEMGACYETSGGPGGVLGYPTSERVACLPSPQGTMGYVQRFEGGSVYWSVAYDAHRVTGAIAAKYEVSGGPGSRLGFPVSDASAVDRGVGPAGGTRQRFEGGWIYDGGQAGEEPEVVYD